MTAIDRRRVRHSFEQHAGEYDAHACVQKRVVRGLAEILKVCDLSPRGVLDIGSGTGALLAELSRLYPNALLMGVDLACDMAVAARTKLAGRPVSLATGDAEYLPFRPGSFDLVTSTSTFQWLDTLDTAFAEAYQALRPNGTFAFALFGEKTLFELKDSYRSACALLGREGAERTQRFFGRQEVEEALAEAGFAEWSVFSALEVETHPDVPTLLRSIRSIGAGNPAPVASRGLSERRVMLEMMEIYCRTYGKDDGIPATYDIVFGTGRKRCGSARR